MRIRPTPFVAASLLMLSCASGPETMPDSDAPGEGQASQQVQADRDPTGTPLATTALAAAKEDGRQALGLPPTAKPPATRTEPVKDTLHGVEVADPYRWLEDEKAPEVKAWMDAQDAFTRKQLQALPGRDALAKRFRDLFYVDSISAPARRGSRFFYVRTHADKEKGILYWRDGEKGAEKVLLDPNTWSPDGNISLGRWVPSWDGKKVVFQKKPNAADEAILHVVDVDTGKWSDTDVIPGGKYASPDWTPDNKGFVYEWLPTDPSIPVDQRPGYTELRFHKLGDAPEKDCRLHGSTQNPSTFLDGVLSRDGQHLFVHVIRGWTENDIYVQKRGKKGFGCLSDILMPAAEVAKLPPETQAKLKAPRTLPEPGFSLLVQGKDAKYEVEAWKGNLYIVTDEGAPKQRVFKTRLTKLDRKAWKEIVPEDPNGAALESATIVGGHLALTYLKNAASELRVTTLEGKPVRTLELPTVGSASNLVGLQDQDDAYFLFSSFTVPRQVYRTSVKTGKVDLWAKVELPIDPAPYTVEQVWYPSKDGTRISMFLVHKKGLEKTGNHPTLLYGYGGFNVSLTPGFRASIYPWLEAGGIFAVPNLRGGGEYGKAWHEAGRLANKQNVFDDFIGAQQFLVQERYTRPEKLAIWGGSNGGLLVGASMVQRPELVGAVVCAVPLLDMVRYHLFGSGRTWIPEYGTAEKADEFRFIHAYSPYHHVKPGTKYPALLMMAADHDDRVDPMHARKFTAAIQAATSGDAPVWLRIEKNAGHGGADQVKQAIESSADMFAFLFKVLGVNQGSAQAPAPGNQPAPAGQGS